jgi:hypothetical protein
MPAFLTNVGVLHGVLFFPTVALMSSNLLYNCECMYVQLFPPRPLITLRTNVVAFAICRSTAWASKLFLRQRATLVIVIWFAGRTCKNENKWYSLVFITYT